VGTILNVPPVNVGMQDEDVDNEVEGGQNYVKNVKRVKQDARLPNKMNSNIIL
jgi:hypothetical protein